MEALLPYYRERDCSPPPGPLSPWDGEAQSLLQVMWWDNSLQQIQTRPRVTA